MTRHFFLLLICLSSSLFCLAETIKDKSYIKEYYSSGTLKSEGWLKNGLKTAYWKHYYLNGKIKKEGHYQNGQPVKYWYFYTENGILESEGRLRKGKKLDWWIFYDANGVMNHKCQLKNDEKNGYCFRYSNSKLIKAEKYISGKKIKEWTDYNSFRRDNKWSNLQQ
jgi:antitoxin component YwqK of YwqJK toxin-antitoxin module